MRSTIFSPLSKTFVGILLGALSISSFAASNSDANNKIDAIEKDVQAIDRVWSGHFVRPQLITRGEHQFVGYYDTNRQMTIAHRIKKDPWRYYKVDSWVGWDSHNSVVMELDTDGHLHVSGNIHNDNLEYFRTSRPFDVRSLRRIPNMASPELEKNSTYPVFFVDPKNTLYFKYRNGSSGNGNEIYYVYNTKKQSWARLHNSVFVDGEGLMNAYFEGPTLGSDGKFHLVWVWRDTPDAASNHDLSYARSSDLIHWETSQGKPLKLPITLATAEIVDAVPAGGGMLNGGKKLGFDAAGKPLIAYHKFAKDGNTQVFIARPNAQGWESIQISDWKNFRWEFGGGGSLPGRRVMPYSPELATDGSISLSIEKDKEITRFILDAQSLKTKYTEKASQYPSVIYQTVAQEDKKWSAEGSQINIWDGGKDAEGNHYYLSWQSLSSNRDASRRSIPEPSTLRIHQLNSVTRP